MNNKTITTLALGKHEKDAEDDKTLKVNRQLFCRLCADADDYINEHLEEEDSDYTYYQGRSDALHELYRGECKAAEVEDKLLCVSRKQIDALQGEIFKAIMDANDADDWQDAAHYILDVMPRSFAALFGSKCLPDAREFNFVSIEPKPAEPKNEGTRQEQYVPKNAESGTYSFNHILKDGFHDHNRLHIAAMAMQGILSNADRMKVYEHVATEPPCEELTVVVARNALRYADELLRQSGEGDSK